MNAIVDAIAAWKSGEDPERVNLLRELTGYDDWRPTLNPKFEGDSLFDPFEEDMMPLHTDAETGEAVYILCTCGEAGDLYGEKYGEVNLSDREGWEVFGAPLTRAEAILIDPGMPHELRIPKEDFESLKVLAEAVAVERAWVRIGHGEEDDGDVQCITAYGGYHVAAVQRAEGAAFITVPHDDGRMFLPLFTREEALARALGDFQANFSEEELRIMQVDGAHLFPVLANEVNDGVVFNYRGPAEPLAFRQDFATSLFLALATRGEQSV